MATDKREGDSKQATPEKSAFSASSISLPKGGGAIRGIGEKFAANPVTGTGSMTVPIAASPGRSGFGPQLALSYDSGSGNGPFGFGWSLSLPSITRKTDKGLPQYLDGGKNQPDSDIYILSGAEDLVPVLTKDAQGNWTLQDANSPDGDYHIRRYCPRIEGLFARIERWTNKTTGEIHWRSITRDNITTLYGKDNKSRIFDPADLDKGDADALDKAHPRRIFSWLICQSYDDKGNAIVYEYQAEDSQRIFEDQQGQVVGLAHERNRNDCTRLANRYLKRIRYGNREPNRDAATWHATNPAQLPNETWMFEVVLDYGEGHYAEDAPDAQGRVFALAQVDYPAESHWLVRQDPFSSYRAGFEIRTYRLCQRVLMFHHFPNELETPDYLVRSTEFSYSESPIASFITSVTQSGYVRQPTQDQANRYLKKSLPPLEFEYSQVPNPEQLAQQPIREVDAESLENLPVGLDGANFQWMDLDGEGTSGILTEQADGWYYKRNLSANNQMREDGHERTAVHFGPAEVVASKPAGGLAGGGQFLDLAGDGQVDLVQMEGPVRGFYERTDDASWAPFQPFASWPDLNTRDLDLRFVDLTGDGHADILITEGEALTWYPSLAEEGFGPAVRLRLPQDEEKGPRLVFADGTQSIYLADLSGDGLSDLVRIRNGQVCYWPNLGYGHFGAKVTMDHAPWFDSPDQFDQRRIRLADIDGSGTTDILYLHGEGVHIYFNQSGNRWSDAVGLPQFPPINNIASVQALDLLDNGTACLVWSSALPNDSYRPMRYIALMEEKPHLLVSVKNDLGAETKVHYAPSTKFYLDDKRDGMPWITRLPFPVHVVERVETYDYISRNRFVSRYAYHHGYFDGVEREFRGFGRVDQQDTEEIGTVAPGTSTAEDTNWDAASFVPPVLTRTWFHTGTYIEGERVSKQFEHEYYREGDASRCESGLSDQQLEAMLLDDTVLPVTIRFSDETRAPYSLSGDEAREACRSLKGAILRQEIYALDKNPDGTPTEESDRPYSVSERNYTIELLQPQKQNRHAVFFTHARETVDFHYERKLYDVPLQTLASLCAAHGLALAVDESGHVTLTDAQGSLVAALQVDESGNIHLADPRVTHAMTLRVDAYGNVLQSVAIGYGRRYDDPDPLLTGDDRGKQSRTLITTTENGYTNPILETDTYRAPLPCEARTYELLQLTPASNEPLVTNLFRFDKMAAAIEAAGDGQHDLPYEDVNGSGAQAGHPYRRLVEHVRTLYRPDDMGAAQNNPLAMLPLGKVEPHALPGESYKLAFTPGLLTQVFRRDGQPLLPDLSAVLGQEGRFVRSQDQKALGLFPAGDPDDTWWIPTGRVYYHADPDAGSTQELAEARLHFFLPRRFVDPFDQKATVDYDHDLLLARTEDALQNMVIAANDYRVLQPGLVTDPNGNRVQVAFDALGLVAGTAVMGKDGERLGDMLDGFEPNLDNDALQKHLADPLGVVDPSVDAHDILGRATTRLVYDLFAYRRTRDDPQPQPAVVYTLARETHDADPGGQQTKIQHSFSYSDGFGREIQKKIQAEPGPLEEGGPDVAPRWVGSGWTVFNNKGKPVRQYEPFFTDTHRFEFDVRIGVSPVLFYDPVERVVATLHPNHTYEKVIFDPWRQATWDVNDTALLDPPADPDVGEFFRRLPEEDYLPTWYARRTDPALLEETWPGDENEQRRVSEQSAAGKTSIHANTPTVAYFDTLGRAFLTVAHNRFVLDGAVVEPKYAMRVEIDIENNQRAVIDAQDRIVMRYDYDMLSNRIHQASMEAGERWTFGDVTGKPIRAWDSRGFMRRMTYDELRRPTGLYVTENGVERLAERTAYGESQGDAKNHKTRVYQVFDGAGIVTSEAYDFKGNLLESTHQLLKEYKIPAAWNLAPETEIESFASQTKYDALNRPVEIIAPHSNKPDTKRNTIYPVYNEANLLEGIKATLNGATEATVFVKNIDYNAKGQRDRIDYGNGVSTLHEYDPLTFRLIHLLTIRGKQDALDCSPVLNPRTCEDPPAICSRLPSNKCILQNLYYTHDPAGNITHIQDDAQQIIYFRNRRVEPSADYTYDAIYRVIEASGREHLGQVGGVPVPTSPSDAPRVGQEHPTDGEAMGRYQEFYAYDEVGNFNELRHVGTDPVHPGWTRSYDYRAPSLIEPDKYSNRLTSATVGNETEGYTYNEHGDMTSMPHLPLMDWNYKDQLHATSQQVRDNGGTPEITYYVYDAAGQRVRKVTERQADPGAKPTRKDERIYLGGYEIYRKYNGSDGNDPKLERETLHVMDDKQRIALVETRTLGDDGSPVQLIRYQLGNHLGSASLELDEMGEIISYEEYYPYGSTSYQAVRKDIEVPAKRYRYTGKERDEESGLYYHGARYYAPWLGRWTSCDPKDFGDIATGSGQYIAVGDNPVRLIDPNGRDIIDVGLDLLKRLFWTPSSKQIVMALAARAVFSLTSPFRPGLPIPQAQWPPLGAWIQTPPKAPLTLTGGAPPPDPPAPVENLYLGKEFRPTLVEGLSNESKQVVENARAQLAKPSGESGIPGKPSLIKTWGVGLLLGLGIPIATDMAACLINGQTLGECSKNAMANLKYRFMTGEGLSGELGGLLGGIAGMGYAAPLIAANPATLALLGGAALVTGLGIAGYYAGKELWKFGRALGGGSPLNKWYPHPISGPLGKEWVRVEKDTESTIPLYNVRGESGQGLRGTELPLMQSNVPYPTELMLHTCLEERR
jgi:RHS repeat-associated protein